MIEGCDRDAPFGIGFPGVRSQVPEAYRGKYLWHCSAHAGEAEKRRDAAYARAVQRGEVRPLQMGLFSGVVEVERRRAR